MQTGNSRRYTSFCSMETGRGREKRKKFRDISYRGLIALSFIDETSSNDNYYVELEGQVRIDELLTNGFVPVHIVSISNFLPPARILVYIYT